LGHARVALRGEPIVGIAPDRIRDLGVERIPAPRRSPSWRCQPAGHAREYETNENCLLKRAPAAGPAGGNDDAGGDQETNCCHAFGKPAARKIFQQNSKIWGIFATIQPQLTPLRATTLHNFTL